MMLWRRIGSVAFLVLFLVPSLVQGFSIERNIGASAFYAAYRDASTGWRIEGSFSSSSGIEFFICDADNYVRWKRHESVSLYEHNEASSSMTFNFTVPHEATWYVVFSNVESQNLNNLDANFYFIDQADVVHSGVAGISQSTILTPTMIGFLIAVPVICLLGVWISRRSEQFPAVKYDEILPKSN
jgi:hypothetical protein